MARGSWFRSFKEAYIDLHVAYLALIRMRNERKNALPLVIQNDMEREDPFDMKSPSGPDAVKRWKDVWVRHEDDNKSKQAMAAVTETMANHWKSWKAFMDLCPPDLKKFKIDLPFDSYMLTATTISRGTLEKRARVLREAFKRHVKGKN
ncbi:MAG: hypothetical protein ACYTHM_18170 [Planctomycetota bacterium]|jgi:hypothetical protein